MPSVKVSQTGEVRDLPLGRSYLWLGSVPQELIDSVSLVDRLILDARELTMEAVKEASVMISYKPVGVAKLVIITNAEQLSALVQNRLLKTLEEPPGYCWIILQTSQPHQLLATVRSRLQRRGQSTYQTATAVNDILTQVEKLKDRAQVMELVRQHLSALNQQLLVAPSLKLVSQLQAWSEFERRLSHNLNIKLALGALRLRLGSD